MQKLLTLATGVRVLPLANDVSVLPLLGHAASLVLPLSSEAGGGAGG